MAAEALHGQKIRRHITVRPEEQARLLAACEKDRGASLSHWLVGLGLARADELGIEHEAPPTPQKRAAKKATAKKRS